MSRIAALKELTGISLANCFSCACGSADSEGEMGQTVYCGMVCGKRHNEDSGVYIEDDGLDAETEKPCWEPEFWASKEDLEVPIDGTDESVSRALDAFMKKVSDVESEHGKAAEYEAKEGRLS